MGESLLLRLGDWEPTRATLHAYARAVAAIPRAHAAPHPRWWHVSLTVEHGGLVTNWLKLPGGGTLRLRMDMDRHLVALEGDAGGEFGMAKGLTATELAEELIRAVSVHGVRGEYQRSKFENDEPRLYEPEAASRFFTVLRGVNDLFQGFRASLSGERGPVQLWPHGFDLAFEWFGTRVETHEGIEYPSQISLGYYPSGRAYFYCNPWPFERDRLLGRPLPSGAEWFVDSWEGTILYYEQLEGDPEAANKLLDYARAVHELAAPTLA